MGKGYKNLTKDKIISSLQTFFGVTKAEIIFAGVIILGLLIGLIINLSSPTDSQEKASLRKQQIYKSLDSLAEVNKSTYVGTDLEGNTIERLSRADTIVKKEQYYGKQKKKLPTKAININTASKTELMQLPSVGEKTADLIIAYRKNRLFQKPADIKRIKGIGKKKYEKLKEYIVVK